MPHRLPVHALAPLCVAVGLGACATRHGASQDEGAERIEAILGEPAREEPIPEGIVFIPDTTPTPEDVALATRRGSEATPGSAEPPDSPTGAATAPAWGALGLPFTGLCSAPPWPAGSNARGTPPACLLLPGTIRMHVAPRPGGSIPGLLP